MKDCWIQDVRTPGEVSLNEGLLDSGCESPKHISFLNYLLSHRFVGQVVRESVSRADDPGFDSRLRRGDFSGSSHTGDSKIGTPVTTLPGA